MLEFVDISDEYTIFTHHLYPQLPELERDRSRIVVHWEPSPPGPDLGSKDSKDSVSTRVLCSQTGCAVVPCPTDLGNGDSRSCMTVFP